MQLKDFQIRSLDALRDYFRLCVEKKNANTAFYEATLAHYGMGIPYIPAPELPDLPYICLRLPTGGGKTFVAAHSIGVAAKELLHTDEPLVLWLVPSNAILQQTLKALRDRKHPYRQAIETAGTHVTVMDISEALAVQSSQLQGVSVIVSTMQAFRVEETLGRKVYEQNGALMEHFSGLKTELLAKLEKHENGVPVYSLANVLAAHRPILIVDEAHNARTDLSFTMLKRFAPSCIIEFTATPDTEEHPSNILHTVSAAELKAEGMIKLPIHLETHQDWRVAISQAVAKRNELEALSRTERSATGEYLRPIVLLQAQPTYKNKDSLTVETVKECLLKDNQIPKEQVAIATGDTHEIEDVDLFAPECPIRYIITVQALREGWDCSFAYVLCSVAELHGQTAVEQILGRVLRLPSAKNKQALELNRAYAFATSLHFAQTANNLADALIQNGFERQEVRDLILPAQQPPLTDLGPLFNQSTTEYAIEGSRKALKLKDEKPPEPFSIPVLGVNLGDFIDQFEESYFEEIPINLPRQDPYLSEAEFPKDAPDGMRVTIDINTAGRIATDFIGELQEQEFLLSADQGVTKETLAGWLDNNISHRDIPQNETRVFFLAMIERLLENGRWNLGELWREKYRLKEAARKLVDKYRRATKTQAFALALFSTSKFELMVTPERCFTFDPENYPYPPNSLFAGHHTFKKHYYPVVGDFKSKGEEFQCAQLLDSHPKVKRWVRNLEGRPQHSFWLQTSTDRFYPDFVCELTNGHFLVVEYKGFDRWSDDDSKEKRTIGNKWEALSDGDCLFLMPQGPDWNAILAKLQ
jgi:type III restriction enzyme